jgi:hypothetical protein
MRFGENARVGENAAEKVRGGEIRGGERRVRQVRTLLYLFTQAFIR